MVYRRTERVARRLAARHDAILAAAQELAEQIGMTAVQVVPVAERAGIAAGTVYRYFPSKGDLIGQLAGRVSANEVDAMRQAVAAAPGPLSAVAAALATFAGRAVQRRRLIWALTGEPADAETEAARSTFRTAIAAELQRPVETAADAKLIASDAQADFAAAALLGALLEGLIGPLAPELESGAGQRQAVQAFTLLALRGIGVSDARARGLVVQTALPESGAQGAAPAAVSATSAPAPSSTAARFG
jgi:AcrR family transcriptional regulator